MIELEAHRAAEIEPDGDLLELILTDTEFQYTTPTGVITVPAPMLAMFADNIGRLLRDAKLVGSLAEWAGSLLAAGAEGSEIAPQAACNRYIELRGRLLGNLRDEWETEAAESIPGMDEADVSLADFTWRVRQTVAWLESLPEVSMTLANQRQIAKSFPELFLTNMASGSTTNTPPAGAFSATDTPRAGNYL